MSIPPGTDTEKSFIGGVPLLNGIAHYSSVRIGEFFLYTANGSKNRSGCYKDHSKAKQVKHL